MLRFWKFISLSVCWWIILKLQFICFRPFVEQRCVLTFPKMLYAFGVETSVEWRKVELFWSWSNLVLIYVSPHVEIAGESCKTRKARDSGLRYGIRRPVHPHYGRRMCAGSIPSYGVSTADG